MSTLSAVSYPRQERSMIGSLFCSPEVPDGSRRTSQLNHVLQLLTTAMREQPAPRIPEGERKDSEPIMRSVPQDPNDEPASVLLERIRKEREGTDPAKKTRSKKA